MSFKKQMVYVPSEDNVKKVEDAVSAITREKIGARGRIDDCMILVPISSR